MLVGMSSALSQITERVRERIRSEGVDLDRDPGLAARYVDHEVALYSERALGGSVPMLGDEAGAARRVLDALTGFGALQPLLDDPSVEEIWINAPDAVFIARGGRSSRLPIALSEGEVRDLVERMLRGSGRRVDLSSPFVDASLPDGSRLHVVIPDVTARHWAVNIRKFSRAVRTLSQLRENGSVTDSTAAFLRACVLSGQNILVSGRHRPERPRSSVPCSTSSPPISASSRWKTPSNSHSASATWSRCRAASPASREPGRSHSGG